MAEEQVFKVERWREKEEHFRFFFLVLFFNAVLFFKATSRKQMNTFLFTSLTLSRKSREPPL